MSFSNVKISGLQFLCGAVCLTMGWLVAELIQKDNHPEVSAGKKVVVSSRSGVQRPFHSSALTSSLSKLGSPKDCLAAIEALEADPDLHPLIRGALRDQAIRVWLELDPASALAHAEKSKPEYPDFFGSQLFRVWLDLDPEAAAEAFSRTSSALFKVLEHRFSEMVAKVDLRLALVVFEKINERKDEGFDSFYLSSIYHQWALKDPQAAMAHYLESRLLTDEYFPLVAGIFRGWAAVDPVAAWDYYQVHKNDPKMKAWSRSVEASIALHLLERDPSYLSQLNTGGAESIARRWVQQNPESAIAFANTLSPDDPWRYYFTNSYAGKLIVSDPAQAIQLLIEASEGPAPFKPEGKASWFGKTYGSGRSQNLSEAFSVLSSQDTAKAMELLTRLPENDQENALGAILKHQFMADDTAAACEFCQTLWANSTNHSQLLGALKNVLRDDRRALDIDFSVVLQEIPEARSLMKDSAALGNWIRSSPESAAEFIREEVLAGNAAEALPKSTDAYANLAVSNPDFTSEWIHTLPPGDFQNEMSEVLMLNWPKYDPDAARVWLDNLPDGPMREKAEEAFKKSE